MNFPLNKTIKNIVPIILALIIILTPNIFLAFYGSDFSSTGVIKRLTFILLSFILLIAPLILIRPKIFLFISLIFVLAAPFEIVNIYLYRINMNSGIMYAVITTNTSEAFELVKGLLPFVLFTILYISLYLYLVIKGIPLSLTITKRNKIIIGFGFLVIILGMWIRDMRISHSIYTKFTASELLNDGTSNFISKFSKIFPYSTIIQANQTYSTILEVKRCNAIIKDFRFNAYTKDTMKINEKYILIIGETSRSRNYELYGYSRKTNPELSKISNLAVLSDFTSTSNLTSLSIPLMLTRATPDNFHQSYTEKSLISAFKECGYHTYWISNQGIFSTELLRFTVDIDKVFNLNSNADFKGNYDENVFPFLDSVLRKNDQKQLIVINLMGSHFRYNFRYPERFNKFKPGLDGAFDYMAINKTNKEFLVNIYDNSILYNDFVVSEIIKKIDNTSTSSFLLYASDHGEELFDTPENNFGHGSEHVNKYNIKIPCIVWYSTKFKENNPIKIKSLESNKYKPMSSNNIFYSILDAGNIEYTGNNLKKSFVSSSFKPDSIRKALTPGMKVISFTDLN